MTRRYRTNRTVDARENVVQVKLDTACILQRDHAELIAVFKGRKGYYWEQAQALASCWPED